MTISSVFIRRPRLAFVISTVITLAGLIALRALPVAQFPDIVPPQVKVTTFYPGASAQAVEESVAQVIEAQVNGVERMIYMKSVSGGDGSYSLTVSFEVGSDPDLNTVNVNNRVNQALAQFGGRSSVAHGLQLDLPLREARDAFEKAYFEFHLMRENGSMTRVAEKTGLERTHLYRKLRQLGVDLSKAKKGGL